MAESERDVACTYAIELILCGAALSRDGDGARVLDLLHAEIMSGHSPVQLISAVKSSNAQAVWDWLGRYGINRINDERAVDSLLRVYLSRRENDLKNRVKLVSESISKENERAESQLKTEE